MLTGSHVTAKQQVRHIHLEFGALTLDFRGGAEQIQNVADELAQTFPEFVVTVDDEVAADLPVLPCAELWD